MPPSDAPPPGGFRTITGYNIGPQQRQAIESGIARGLGANAVYNAMRDAGIAPRRQAALDAYGEIAGTLAPASRLNRAQRSYIPTPADYRQLIGAQRTYDRYRVVGSLDLTAFGADRVFWGFSKTSQQRSLDHHASTIFGAMSKVIQSFKAQNPDAEIDVSPDDVSFYSFESWSTAVGGGL